MPRSCLSLAVAGTACCASVAAAQQRGTLPVYHLPELRVEIARLGFGGVPLARAPFGAQVLAGEEVRAAGHLTLADALLRLPAVSAADVLGSPFQPDVMLRGFGISLVMGLPHRPASQPHPPSPAARDAGGLLPESEAHPPSRRIP